LDQPHYPGSLTDGIGVHLLKLFDRFSIRKDLGVQLMLLYGIFVGMIVGLTLLFAQATRQRLEDDIKAADLALARSIAQDTNVEMGNAMQAVRELGGMDVVLDNNIIQMESLFRTIIKVRPDVSSIHRLNSQGFMLFHYPSEPSSFVGSDLSYQDYFQRAQVTTRALISKGNISMITDEPVATAFMPLWDERAQFKGLVAMDINLESLSQTLWKIANEYNLEEGFQVVIIDSSRQVIAHPDSEKLLTETPDSQFELFNVVLLGKAGNIIGRDDSGRETLYSFVPITSSGWGVIVSRPTSTAFATSQSFYQGVLIILLIFVVVGVLFWLGLNRQAIRPLSHLVEFSQAIGHKQGITDSQRVNLSHLSSRTDQVGNLTNSLIRMEKAINARLKELSILLQTSTYVLSSLDSQVVLGRILDQVDELLNVEMSAVVALDERLEIYMVQASHGLSKSYIESIKIDPDDPQSVTSRAIHSGSPVQVIDTETDIMFTTLRDRARAEGYRSILAIPLTSQHAPPSALLIFRPDPHVFSQEDVTILSNFANHAALAIENAALYARSDMRLQVQTRRLESLIQSLNDGLILVDLEGNILYVNRILCEWTNLHHEELIGNSIEKFFDKLLEVSLDPDKARQETKAVFERHGERIGEISIQYQGQDRHLRLRVFNVTDSRNFPIGYGQILQDITSDYEIDRLKSNLISTVSHELRTPLASIKGYTTTLLADDVKWNIESQNEFLSIISEETDRLSTLVDDLLDLSRIEAGDAKVSKEQCDFTELVERAAVRASPQPGDRLILNFPTSFPLLELDIQRIEVVMRNLIENATKYANPESPIRVSANLDNGNLLVKVEDQGPGIPVKESQRIFDSFYRLDREISHSKSGFGLGLSICQGFIKAHGGEIWTESNEAGARFVFSLPVKISSKR